MICKYGSKTSKTKVCVSGFTATNNKFIFRDFREINKVCCTKVQSVWETDLWGNRLKQVGY